MLADRVVLGALSRVLPHEAGNLLVYAIKSETGEPRAYRVDRIDGVHITNTSFTPRYAIELSHALPVRSGRHSR
jgi:hypothetical protein